MHNGIIKNIRFFDDKDNNFIGSIVPLLTPLKTMKHEFIYKKNNHPNAIFFITQGKVAMIERKTLSYITDLEKDQSFGEIAFFTGAHRIVSAKSRDYTDVLIVNLIGFLEVAQDFEEALVTISAIIKEYRLCIIRLEAL